jgi:hypothetical protein
VPLITQSDAGTENYGVANAQTMFRQRLDPTLTGTLQHRWMRKKQNIKAEANWSVFRRDFTPGFENLFDRGVNQGWYDADNSLEKYVAIHLSSTLWTYIMIASFLDGSLSLGFSMR